MVPLPGNVCDLTVSLYDTISPETKQKGTGCKAHRTQLDTAASERGPES